MSRANRPTPRWFGPLMAGLSLVLSLGFAELLLHILAPLPDPYEHLKRTHSSQYINNSYPPHYRGTTEMEKELGLSKGKRAFSTNNMGFRGPDLVQPKQSDEYRIFLVGGSTIEGFYLDDSEGIHSVIQHYFNNEDAFAVRVRVYNAGQAGGRTDDHVSLIVHRLVHLEPDAIVVLAGINDLSAAIFGYDYLHLADARRRISTGLLLRMLATESHIARLGYYAVFKIFPKTERQTLEHITVRSNYQEKIRLRMLAPVTANPPKTNLRAYRNNLQTIVGATKAHGARLVFVTQQATWNSPTDPEVSKREWMLYRDGVSYRADLMAEAIESYNDVMRAVAAKNGIPLYDLTRTLVKSSRYFYDDVHFTPDGAHAAGVGLARFMDKRGLIRSNANGHLPVMKR